MRLKGNLFILRDGCDDYHLGKRNFLRGGFYMTCKYGILGAVNING